MTLIGRDKYDFDTTHCSMRKEIYLDHEFERRGSISIATDNNHNIHITNSHIEKGASPDLANRTCSHFFCLHDMRSECIDHVTSGSTNHDQLSDVLHDLNQSDLTQIYLHLLLSGENYGRTFHRIADRSK